MDWKQLATLKNAYEREKELREFKKKLQEKPLQKSEYESLVNSLNIDSKQKLDMINQQSTLRKNKMLIDDIPEEFESHQQRHKEAGAYSIRKSVFQRMSNEQRERYLQHSAPALYEDSHLEPVKDLNGHIEKQLMDLEVSKNDYKPYYPKKDKV